MKIIYKQPKETPCFILNISNCYFKQLQYPGDKPVTTFMSHHHTDYEIHIVINGSQTYELNGQKQTLEKNGFLIIPPYTEHRIIDTSENMVKYSLTFQCDFTPQYFYFSGILTDLLLDNLNFILSESGGLKYYSNYLISNRIYETILLLFRVSGYQELPSVPEVKEEDDRLFLAKQFIQDNIHKNIQANDVASYCHLSTRQLTRIFLQTEGTALAQYIIRTKMRLIREDIINSSISMKEISVKYGFSNEYYFNNTFKKHYGMSPGTYRKMHLASDSP